MYFFFKFYIYFCSVKEGLDLVKEAISRTGYNDKIKIAINVAATDFCIGDVFFATNNPVWALVWIKLWSHHVRRI